MSQDVKTEMKRVELGIEAESFIQTDIGKELVRRARAHAEKALEQLKKVDPSDAEAIRKLQTEIFRGESFERWLAQMINEGWEAEQNIT